jgi:hypothetical protein
LVQILGIYGSHTSVSAPRVGLANCCARYARMIVGRSHVQVTQEGNSLESPPSSELVPLKTAGGPTHE